MLNLTRHSRLRSHHFNKEKISTDNYTSGDPAYVAWNNRRKPLVWGRLGRHIFAKPQMSVSAATLQVIFRGTWVGSIVSMNSEDTFLILTGKCSRRDVTLSDT